MDNGLAGQCCRRNSYVACPSVPNPRMSMDFVLSSSSVMGPDLSVVICTLRFYARIVSRYTDIIRCTAAAKHCARKGFCSMVLQLRNELSKQSGYHQSSLLGAKKQSPNQRK